MAKSKKSKKSKEQPDKRHEMAIGVRWGAVLQAVGVSSVLLRNVDTFALEGLPDGVVEGLKKLGFEASVMEEVLWGLFHKVQRQKRID